MSTEERLARLEGGYDHVATKAGLENIRGELKAGIEATRGELKAEIETLRGELKADIEATRGELKADIETLRGEVRALAGSFRVWIIVAAILQAGFSALISQWANSGG